MNSLDQHDGGHSGLEENEKAGTTTSTVGTYDSDSDPAISSASSLSPPDQYPTNNDDPNSNNQRRTSRARVLKNLAEDEAAVKAKEEARSSSARAVGGGTVGAVSVVPSSFTKGEQSVRDKIRNSMASQEASSTSFRGDDASPLESSSSRCASIAPESTDVAVGIFNMIQEPIPKEDYLSPSARSGGTPNSGAAGGSRDDDVGREHSKAMFEDEKCVSRALEVDEQAFEREYQQKAVDNMSEVVKAEALDQKDINARNRRICLMRCGFPLCCVGIILAIVLPLTLTKTSENVEQVLVTRTPTDSPTMQAEGDYLAELLEPISGDAIYEEMTPQGQAYNWLLEYDPANLDIRSESESTLINRYTLAVIYYTMGGPQWNDQLNFLSSKNICDWHVERNGILCSETGEPFFMRFFGNGLVGTVPREVSAISTLSELSFGLDWTTITGTVPSELGLLTRLTFLQIAATAVTGTIPSELNNLKNLEIFSFIFSQLSGPLPDLLTMDHSIQRLSFGFNNFSGTIPPLHPNSPLIDFALTDNPVTGTLPSTFYEQPDLYYFDLSGTKITGSIAPEISTLTTLEDVWFSNAKLTGTLPSSLGDMDTLKWVRFSNNDLTGTIPSQLGTEGNKFVYLFLDGNDLAGTIPSELSNLTDLKQLHLAGNTRLGGTVPASFVEGLELLEELSLDRTQLTGNYLNDSYCQLDVLKTAISADCAGETPDMPCDCCVNCCAGDDCELNLPGACSVQAGIATREVRDNTCTCPPDGSKFTCVESCQVCNFEGTVCAQTMGYGFVLNQTTGERMLFENTYRYTLGYEDTVVDFVNDVSSHDGKCTVYLNGEECSTCIEKNCDNGGSTGGYEVNCENIGGGSFKSCDPLASPPGALDVFQFLNGAFTNDTICLPLFPNQQDVLHPET